MKRVRYVFILLSLLIFLPLTLRGLPPGIKFVRAAVSKPELMRLYFTQPNMRALMNLIAEHRIQSFFTVWDTDQGILLSKKIFQPVNMDGKIRYRYLSRLKKLSFQTGTAHFQRKFEAEDTPRLREILSRLDTQLSVESGFDENGFRNTPYGAPPDCGDLIFMAGDSFTEGLWVKDNETFASQFAEKINASRAMKSCVMNSGTNGYGILEESYTARNAYPKFKFQTLFVIHYPNDIHADSFKVLRDDLPDSKTLWAQHFESLSKLKTFCVQNQIRIILVPIPPKEQFAMPETRQNYQDKLAAFCQDHRIEFWDPFDFLKGYTWEEIYLGWDPHFNASGHRLFADFLLGKTLTSPRPEL